MEFVKIHFSKSIFQKSSAVLCLVGCASLCFKRVVMPSLICEIMSTIRIWLLATCLASENEHRRRGLEQLESQKKSSQTKCSCTKEMQRIGKKKRIYNPITGHICCLEKARNFLIHPVKESIEIQFHFCGFVGLALLKLSHNQPFNLHIENYALSMQSLLL